MTDVTVIHMQHPEVHECAMCERERVCNHAVGWWCGPRLEDIGSTLANGEEVGGMSVCRECHDGLYSSLSRSPY